MYHFELKPSRNPQWEKEVEKVFNVFSKNEYFSPPCEILDGEESCSVTLDIPGLSKDDIDIEVKGDHLLISGERKSKDHSDKTTLLRSEKRYGKFERVFTLPKNVKTDGVVASFEHGVLEILIPKEEKSLSKKITISDWKKETSGVEFKN